MSQDRKESKTTSLSTLPTSLTRNVLSFLPVKGNGGLAFFSRINKDAKNIASPDSLIWKAAIENELMIHEAPLKKENESYQQAYLRHKSALRRIEGSFTPRYWIIDWDQFRKLLKDNPQYKNAAIARFFNYAVISWRDMISYFQCELDDDFFKLVLTCKSISSHVFKNGINNFKAYKNSLNETKKIELINAVLNDEFLFSLIILTDLNLLEFINSLTEAEKQQAFPILLSNPKKIHHVIGIDMLPCKIIYEQFNLREQRDAYCAALRTNRFAKTVIMNFSSLKYICDKFPQLQDNLLKRILQDGHWLQRIFWTTTEHKAVLIFFSKFREEFYQTVLEHWDIFMTAEILKAFWNVYPEKQADIHALLTKEPERLNNKFWLSEWFAALSEIGYKVTSQQRQDIFQYHLHSRQFKSCYDAVRKLSWVFNNSLEREQIFNKLLKDETLLREKVYNVPRVFTDFPSYTDKILEYIFKHKTTIIPDVSSLRQFLIELNKQGAFIYDDEKFNQIAASIIKNILEDESYMFSDDHADLIKRFPHLINEILNATFNNKVLYQTKSFIDKLFYLFYRNQDYDDKINSQLFQIIASKITPDFVDYLTHDKREFCNYIKAMSKTPVTYRAPQKNLSALVFESKYCADVLKNVIHFEDDLINLHNALMANEQALLMDRFLSTSSLYMRLISSTEGFASLMDKLPQYKTKMLDLLETDSRLKQLVKMQTQESAQRSILSP